VRHVRAAGEMRPHRGGRRRNSSSGRSAATPGSARPGARRGQHFHLRRCCEDTVDTFRFDEQDLGAGECFAAESVPAFMYFNACFGSLRRAAGHGQPHSSEEEHESSSNIESAIISTARTVRWRVGGDCHRYGLGNAAAQPS
jgi:hypothetical protein